MRQIYRFFIRLGESGQQQAVNPVWKDDMALEYQKESGQQFYRAELSTSMDFIGADYTLITGAAFDTAFFLDIERSANEGGTWIAYWTGRFYMTDCTVDVDNARVTVKPSVYDRYNRILEGMENEYDLIKLTPAITPVTVIRRPVLQVYTLGENVITNVLNTMSWEQDCNMIDSRNELADLHFGEVGAVEELRFNSQITGLLQPFTGSYTGHGNDVGEWLAYTNSEGVYQIKYFQELSYDQQQPQITFFTNGLRIYGVSDNVLYWEFTQQKVSYWYSEYYFDDIPDPVAFTDVASGQGDVTAGLTQTDVFARLVMAVDMYQGQRCYDIPANDIVSTNRNFRYCIPYSYTNVLVQTLSSQSAPTEWGINPNGYYYVKPSPSGALTSVPVGRSHWGLSSTWVKVDSEQTRLEIAGRKETEIRDTFSLEGVISALLGQVDPSLSFGASGTYSEFLYGNRPNWLWSSGSFGRLFMTPKSNILVAEYTMPARKAMVTLKNVLDMLRISCGLYWYIDNNNHLRIEHLSWFLFGGSYSGSMSVGIDLTSLINRNGKKWSWGVNKYKFDKMDMAERYQFGWMDDSTDVFKGMPIEVLSGFVTKGKIEEQMVGAFNSDVDYMMTDPSNVSQDGFALLNCVQSSGKWKTEISTMWVDNQYYTIQNWQMAFMILQPRLLLYDMPARNIRVNGQDVQADGVQRKKMQDVTIPLPVQDPSMNLLVRTGIGYGTVKKMSIRLTSRMAKTTLAFATE